jgi:hypothetical protein
MVDERHLVPCGLLLVSIAICTRPVASSLASTRDTCPARQSDRRSESGEQVGLGDTRALPIADEPFGAEGVPETVFGHGQEE